MRRGIFISILFCLMVIIVVMNACSIQIELPTGTWVSEDDKIVINFSEHSWGENAGTLNVDDKIHPIYWGTDFGSGLSIFEATDDSSDTNLYFYAICKWTNDKKFQMKVKTSKISAYPPGTVLVFSEQEKAEE